MANSQKDSNRNCTLCLELDTNEMVQCDSCDQWFHFGCVGVDKEIANVSWSCLNCNMTISTTSSTLITNGAAASVSTPCSSSENVQLASATRTVGDTLYSCTTCIANAVTTSVPVFTSSVPIFQTAPIMSYTPHVTWQSSYSSLPTSFLPYQQAVHSTYLNQPSSISQPTSTLSHAANAQYTSYSNQIPYFSQPSSMFPQASSVQYANAEKHNQLMKQQELELKGLEEEMRRKREYLVSKYKILSQANETLTCSQPLGVPLQTQMMYAEPTAAQVAARQAIPKELPTFNGDPEDWPLFYSTFENSTAAAGYSHAENLLRLQSCLKGKAREIVKNKLFLPNMVPEIMQTLKMCFGRPEHILDRMIVKAKGLPPIKDRLDSLIEYAMCVRNICATMEGCAMHAHLNNPLLVKELVEKLPNNHKLNWAMSPKDERIPAIKSFSDWLYKMAEAASTVTPLFSKPGAAVNTHCRDEVITKNDRINKNAVGNACIICNDYKHKIGQCEVFKNMPLSEKWKCVKSKNLCRQCLKSHKRQCNSNKECGVDGCKYKHNPLLHKTVSVMENAAQNAQQNIVVNAHRSKINELQPIFRIIPINIHSSNKTKMVYAFLDEGSAVTLMERTTFDELGLEGTNHPLCLRWTGDTTRVEDDSIETSVKVSNIANNKMFQLNGVHTVKSLGLMRQTIDVSEMAKKYPYLKDLPIQSYQNATPTILIGANNWKLAIPLKIKEGSWHQPIATKTRLGWTLQGCKGDDTAEYRINSHTCDCQQMYEELHDMVKNSFSLEAPPSTQLFSADDNKALHILKQTCKQLNNRYEVGLLWRNQNIQLPDNYASAFNRLKCLENKFNKTPEMKITTQSQIDNLVSKGYARKLTTKDLEMQHDKIWYLPIFTVKNPNKPNKIRLVWDAAAKSNGVSLNDFLCPGPDLLNSLLEILLKFRVGRIAICGDISEMFHRITVNESDMHAQRFLWYNKGDKPNKPSVFVMHALTFGICCAPCIAHFVRDTNAERFEDKYPRAVEAIKQNHYVDDFIDSAASEEEAEKLAKLVKNIHAEAGFEMHNWSSNSKKVLNGLQNDSLSQQTPIDWGNTTKILGLYWDPSNDEFKYTCRFARLRRDVLTESIVPTKRETLQVLMSVFDPLGFVSCYIIGLKVLLQEIWRSGIAWDEQLPLALYEKWCSWKSTIPKITAVRIPRCYFDDMPQADEIQLHTFVDASEKAYAAVCYLRIKKKDEITISLVVAKNKVAPLKPLSVPRLELQAALLGTRLAKIVTQVRRIEIHSQFYWTDAKTILKWLQMDPKNFQQFVMHRVGEILESSNVDQWMWVPTKQNPADLATKMKAPLQSDLWFNGPKFLHAHPNEWPQCDDLGKLNETEIKRCALVIQKNVDLKLKVEYFSSWKHLYRAVATFILYLHKLEERVKNKATEKHFVVDNEMIKKAQIFLIKYAQQDAYSYDINNLKHKKPIEKKSKLFNLNVYLDENDVVKCRGRNEFLNNHEDAIVLPNNHAITYLVVRHFHEKLLHQSHETAINEIKGQFYITRLRVLFRKVRRNCQWCKNFHAAPTVPQMAVLPVARLGAFERPFTFVGIDYFGPINVAVGRRREKRWGVIFTCLTIRAVHIEVAYSLDTSSCVMCIRNFISRRGTPKEIYSDNGTNFKASEKILCGLYTNNVNLKQIQSSFEQIKWRFNPPSAPHMGGAWERLVRSIKTVICKISPTMSFNDESLKSALCEVEYMINCRPLTFVSLESTDDEAITPNHLLLGSSDGYKPMPNENIDLRQRWHKTQAFAEQFWRRWLKEYIPIISRRTKWFVKQQPVKIGDIVIIVDPDLPKNVWPKGVVIDAVIAKDHQVRRVTIRTKNGILQRPVAKVAVLDVSGSSEGKQNSPNSFTGEGIVAADSHF